MQKEIRFGNTRIKVTNVYSFKYNNGKRVLRVSASESDVDEATLKLLRDNTAPIEYYETEDTTNEDGSITEGTEFVLKKTYEGYDSGEYMSGYANGVYEAEVTRVEETEKAIRQNTANIEYLAIMGGIDL